MRPKLQWVTHTERFASAAPPTQACWEMRGVKTYLEQCLAQGAAAAAAKSLQSCPTLCSPIDGSSVNIPCHPPHYWPMFSEWEAFHAYHLKSRTPSVPGYRTRRLLLRPLIHLCEQKPRAKPICARAHRFLDYQEMLKARSHHSGKTGDPFLGRV